MKNRLIWMGFCYGILMPLIASCGLRFSKERTQNENTILAAPMFDQFDGTENADDDSDNGDGTDGGCIPFACPAGFVSVNVIVPPLNTPVPLCVTTSSPARLTNAGVCQDGAILDVDGHCVCEQQNNQCVGGVIIDTDTVSLLAGAIGIDPLLTGLIGITIGGLAVQAVWFVHRMKKKVE